MNCEEVRVQLGEKLDGELAASAAKRLDEHLAECAACGREWSDLQTLRQILAQPAAMPAPLARIVWKKLDRRAKRRWWASLGEAWSSCSATLRDLDRTVLWARLSAVPIMLAAVLLVLPLLPKSELEKWTYTLVASRSSSSQPLRSPVMVQVVQPRNEFLGLVETAWKIPYEDSLWLVADIQPEGNAHIGNVIEYPKNSELLEAVDQTLRNSRFDVAGNLEAPQFIYGFQKVDVYEQQVF